MRANKRSVLQRFLTTFYTPSKSLAFAAVILVVVSSVGMAWFVYVTGGVKFAALHALYLPVIVAALVFGVRGGIPAGIFVGLLIGPFMPLDVAAGEPQNPENWLYRLVFFCLIGGIAGVGVDTLRRQLALLDWLNEHDARTGLLDQTGLLKRVDQMLAAQRNQVGPFLVVAQINNFAAIQDTFGPSFAEKLLALISERGRALLPPGVPIGLIQADRLAAVFASRQQSQRIREMVDARVRAPYEIDGVPVYVDFCIGAAEYPVHANTADELLQKACIAVRAAATGKRSFYVYDSARDLTSHDNLRLLGLIPAALAHNEFVVWHQARVALETGEVSNTEALLRWIPQQGELIPPSDFIPQAEESALINPLTERVIDSAIADMAAWTARGHPIGVAINLSVRNLHDTSLIDVLRDAARGTALDPGLIELEITESAVMDDFDQSATLVSRLRDYGFRVSIDDFGIGHASLAYLKRLPVTGIKIDQTFVRNLANDANDQKIVRAILGLADSFALDCTAEGIEDAQTVTLLRDWGCKYGQGFYLHRPVPYAELIAWLEKRPVWNRA
jgi:EAL domain-containing protein (putative c-di-GMP-specific phosphodiesterase class I)/GGDEF domain-containing protein